MATDDERLVVLLEARIRDFERNMQKASGTAERQFGRMRQDSQRATRQMEVDMERATGRMSQALAAVTTRAGTLAAAFGPMAAGVGVAAASLTGFVAQAQQVARGIATIGDEAKRAGISVKSFQELKFVADQNRVSIDALTDGIKEMNLRADEFIVTGSGSGAEAFKRLGFTASELATKLKDPSALFTEIIGKLEHLDRAAQIRIADEIFGGTGGEQFVQLLEQGEAGIRRTIDEANRLGLVMDEAMIKRAAEVDRQFQIITQTVGVSLKSAIVDAASGLADFIDGFREFENQRNISLNEELTSLGMQRLEIENKILDLRAQQAELTDTARSLGFGEMGDRQIAQLEEENAALAEQEQKILGILKARGAFGAASKETAAELRDLANSGAAAGDSLGYIERNGGAAAAGIDATGDAAKRTTNEFDAFIAKADRYAEKLFPGEYARREAEGLLTDLERFGDKLDVYQRAGIENRVAGLGKGITEQFDEADQRAQRFQHDIGITFHEIGDTFESTVGGAFMDVFTGGMRSTDEFFDHVIEAFVPISPAQINAFFDTLEEQG